MNMENRLLYLKPLAFILKVALLFTVFSFMNFDSSLNLDYLNYKANYDYNWGQFEIGFELLSDLARYFNLDFESFWLSILIFQILLLSMLYRNNLVFIFAFPNLIYLSQGLLGTQVRFGLAVTFFLLLFSYFNRRRTFLYISLFPILFHNAIVIFFALSLYMNLFFKNVQNFFSKRNIKALIVYVSILLVIVTLIDTLLINAGYDYYVGTKYQEGRSLAGLAYLFVHLFFVMFLLKLNAANSNDKTAIYYKDWLVLSFFILVFAIFFMGSSVISGRLTLVYTLLEPFILYWILTAFKDNVVRGFLFISFSFISYSKLLILNLN